MCETHKPSLLDTHFESNSERELEKDTPTKLDRKVEALFEHDESGIYSVVLHNDPFNEMDFVVHVIRKVFHYSLGKSISLMLKAHFSGYSVLWMGSKNESIQKVDEIISHGPDPKAVHRGAKPLHVTVEKFE